MTQSPLSIFPDFAPAYVSGGVELHFGDCLKILPTLLAGSIEIDPNYFSIPEKRIKYVQMQLRMEI